MRLRHRFADWNFEPDTNRLARGSYAATLEPRVTQLLEFLLAHPDELISHDRLVETLWGGRVVTDESVRRAVSSLRQALAAGGSADFIRTVHKKGYIASFPPPAAEETASCDNIEPAGPDAGSSAAPPPLAGVGVERWRSGWLRLLVAAVLVSSVFVALWLREETDEPTAALTRPTAVAPIPKSIAVLPFVNMSSDKEQEYFSDGMSEELLSLLAKAPDIKVIARTSSFAFKGKDVPIAEIARQLNVAHVLEGSFRKSGNTVRISVQLIRTKDSTQLWAETYDRPLDDIFKVQDEIANAIVQALQIKMTGGTLSQREGGTQNLEAYQLYLRSESALNQSTKASLDDATGYLEKAIEIDPNYGLAWSQLAFVVESKTNFGILSRAEGYEQARELALRALQSSPNIAAAHAELMFVHMVVDFDWVAAKKEEQRALAIDSMDPWALQYAGILSQTLGQFDDAERRLRASLDRDPLNSYTISNLAYVHYLAGRFADAEGMYRKLLAQEPDFPGTRRNIASTLLVLNQPEAALAILQQDVEKGPTLLPVVLQALGRKAEADDALKAQIARSGDSDAFYVAMAYAYRGDSDPALEWLERAYRQKEFPLVGIIGEPLLKNIAHDPRFIALLKKMNLPTEPVPLNWQ